MSAHDIVQRLDFCKQVKSGQWIARCPAHDDKSPSLTVKDVGDGRTLIHCFAGCGAVEVLEAIGLDLQDLYPPTDRNYHVERQHHERTVDELVVEIAMSDMRAGRHINSDDRKRCREALQRLDAGGKGPDIDKNAFRKNAAIVAKRHSERTAQRLKIMRGDVNGDT